MKYFIKYKGQEEKEVTKEEYMRVAKENDPGLNAVSKWGDTPTMIFTGKAASGYVRFPPKIGSGQY